MEIGISNFYINLNENLTVSIRKNEVINYYFQFNI